MKKNAITMTLTAVILGISFYNNTLHAENKLTMKQSALVQNLVHIEKSPTVKGKLISLINWIDSVYSDIYGKLEDRKKIVIFFDPAHGRLPNGAWQGAVTNRLSSTGKPEEYYSIQLSRAFYNLLSNNKHIEVASTPDFMQVLKGKSESYNNISFNETVRLAKKAGAFMLVSEHLNNVSIFNKAIGSSNITGLHIVYGYRGRRMLKYIYGQYSGFLTLYNKCDPTGFSLQYALKLREKLIDSGLTANHWNKGAVGDERFSYFYDYPISIIYESGFISNPEEEEDLRDPEHIQKIVEAQYQSLLENFEDTFGIDISDKNAKKIGASYNIVELLKLTQVSLFYITNGNIGKAVSVINHLERLFKSSKYSKHVRYYTSLKWKLMKSMRYRRLAAANSRYQSKYYRLWKKYAALGRKVSKKSKQYKRYKRNSWIYKRKYSVHRRKRIRYNRLANRYLSGKPVIAQYFYRNKLMRNPYIYRGRKTKIRKYSRVAHVMKRSPLTKQIILPIEKGQTLKEALNLALEPDSETLDKLASSFKYARTSYFRKYRSYSKKRKRRITRWKKVSKKIRFKKGIYVVKLNSKMQVINARKVKTVYLNPWKYQNQQYLKNSYFCSEVREKTL